MFSFKRHCQETLKEYKRVAFKTVFLILYSKHFGFCFCSLHDCRIWVVCVYVCLCVCVCVSVLGAVRDQEKQIYTGAIVSTYCQGDFLPSILMQNLQPYAN